MTSTTLQALDRKASRLKWLHTVPAHWGEKRAKYLFREVDERSLTGSEELLSVSHLTGVTPRSEKSVTMFMAESYVGQKLCRPGDLVVNTMWAWMSALGVSRHTGIVSSSYAVYRPLDGCDLLPEYVDLLLRTLPYKAEYHSRSTGIRSSRLRLYPLQFLDIPVLQPPVEEQEAILRLIHNKTQSINHFILNRRRFIEVLQERRLATIHEAITKGIDGHTSQQETGIHWIEKVPSHWSVSKVKYLARYINGFAFKPSHWGDSGRKIIRIQNLTNPSATFNRYDGELPAKYLVQSGDILLSWSASLGVFQWSGDSAWLNQHIFKVIPNESIVQKDYFVWLASWFLYWMDRDAHGSTLQHITKVKFGAFPVFLPPLSEQRRISAYLANELAETDALILQARREIDLIREFHNRLVTDVVTGTIDMRQMPTNLLEAADGDLPVEIVRDDEETRVTDMEESTDDVD